MANDEHIALLKQGVDAWNAWRGEIQPERMHQLLATCRISVDVTGIRSSVHHSDFFNRIDSPRT